MDEPYRESPVATLGPNKKHCFACAAILDIRAELCPRCGIRQPAMPGMPETTALTVPVPRALARTSRNKTTAGVFALVLGGLGIHKFYLGQTAAGILYLLFCWTFIPAFIAFIEGIIYLTMSEETFAERYPG
jgi:TM2 domain-containing membrane protein YozV